MEIRDALTFELLTTLTTSGARPIAYSPDGRSLACLSDAVLIIWDIQTGGAAKEIGRGSNIVSSMWSLDGGKIGTILWKWDPDTSYIVRVYDVASGTSFSLGTLRSKRQPQLWAHNTSFRVMTTEWDCEACTIEISEVRSALAKIESFRISEPWGQDDQIESFSPTTHRTSISSPISGRLRILDVRNSECLLEGKCDSSGSHCFSSDGSLFALSSPSGLNVWKYIFGHYTPWREFPSYLGSDSSPLQFSSNLSSILGHPTGALQMWYLDGPSVVARPSSRTPLVVLSPCGTYIATGHKGGSTIAITNLCSQTPPLFIDTGMEIQTLALTGNILLMEGLDALVAWRLTEEGIVDDVYTNRRAHLSNSIWIVPCHDPILSVQDQTAFIGEGYSYDTLHAYHIGTGEAVESARAPPMHRPRYLLKNILCGQHYPHYRGLEVDKVCSEDDWPISFATLRKGWIKDPEGKHRFWMPNEWKTELFSYGCWFSSSSGWLSNITTLWLAHETGVFIAMF